MTIRELFKRRVIELIHGLPYDEAKIVEDTKQRKDKSILMWANVDCTQRYGTHPITIGRVMKAIKNGGINIYCNIEILCEERELINEDGSECTDDEQTDEIIEKIYNLIK